MKRTHHLRIAIAGLFTLSLVAFGAFIHSSAHNSVNPPTQNPPSCSVTLPTYGCSLDSNGNPITSIQFHVTHSLCSPTTLTITSSSGTVQPSTFANVTSGSTLSFALFNATSNPVFTFNLNGCNGVSCKTTAQLQSLPTNCGPCTSLWLPTVSACTGIVNGLCQYPFTIHLSNNNDVAGVAVLSSSVGTVSPQTYNISPGGNIISGTLSVPCGTTTVNLTDQLSLGGATAPQTCKANFNLSLPPACVPPTQCAATFPDVSCVKDANGNPIYNITSNVTNNLGCPANLQITSSSGVVVPSTFTNITSPSSVSFSLFGATTTPNFTFNWSGCGKTCNTITKLPNGLPTNCGNCVSLSVPNVGACAGVNGSLCQYPFTMNVQNNTNDPGTVTISPNVGSVSPATFNVNPGVNTISGTLSVPCGTNPVTLTGALTIAGNAALPPQTCKSSITTNVPPPCVCNVVATPADQTICKGGSTHVDVPANTQGSVMWYYANAPCPTTAAPVGWTPLSGGTTWNTLSLDQSTCYEAVVSNMPNCPNTSVSNPVTVNVVDPGSGSISCAGGPCPTDVCSPYAINLTYSNTTASASCTLQWEQWKGSQWLPIPNATGPTLNQMLTSTTCPFSVAKFRMHQSCKGCADTYTEVSFKVYKPTQAGALTVTKPVICEGDDDVLHYTGGCGDVVRWEKSTLNATSGFGPISGSGTTLGGPTLWYTNKLYQDTWYRVFVKNGPCGPKYSNPVKVTVNKKPAPHITAGGPLTFCVPGHVTLTATNPNGGTCQWYRNGLPITGATGMSYTATASGNYYVWCKNGCGKGKSNIIKVKASKVVAAIEGACGVCPPACVNLTAVAGGGVAPYTFVWSPGGGTSQTLHACPTTNTTYTVTVTDANGCSTTATHNVTICPKKLVSDAGKNVTTCPGGQVTIGGAPTASGGTGPYTYSWSPTVGLSSATVANPTASPSQTTTYTVTVTDATGCVSTSTVKVLVKGPPCAEETFQSLRLFLGWGEQPELTNEIMWCTERFVPVNWTVRD